MRQIYKQCVTAELELGQLIVDVYFSASGITLVTSVESKICEIRMNLLVSRSMLTAELNAHSPYVILARRCYRFD